jgi:hypothetical protein
MYSVVLSLWPPPQNELLVVLWQPTARTGVAMHYAVYEDLLRAFIG